MQFFTDIYKNLGGGLMVLCIWSAFTEPDTDTVFAKASTHHLIHLNSFVHVGERERERERKEEEEEEKEPTSL